ncbi:MAG: hypothetical protein NT027_19895 [Proteobacteria bacterium]|nr:hypothetical protein [Pseudomonadota bacterium]
MGIPAIELRLLALLLFVFCATTSLKSETVTSIDQSNSTIKITQDSSKQYLKNESFFLIKDEKFIGIGRLISTNDGSLKLIGGNKFPEIAVDDNLELSHDPKWKIGAKADDKQIKSKILKISRVKKSQATYVLVSINEMIRPIFAVGQKIEIKYPEQEKPLSSVVKRFNEKGIWLLLEGEVLPPKVGASVKISLADSEESAQGSAKSEPESGATQFDDIVDPSSSRAIRATKKFGINFLYTPLSDFMLQYGVSTGMGLTKNLNLSLRCQFGDKKLDDNSNGIQTNATLSGLVFDFNGRYFFGNSFNLLFGVGMRQGSLEYYIADSNGQKIEGDMIFRSFVVPLAIGNHWIWGSGVTFGIDWIGAYFPFANGVTSNFSGTVSGSDAKRYENDLIQLGDETGKKTSLTLFLTSLGYSF